MLCMVLYWFHTLELFCLCFRSVLKRTRLKCYWIPVVCFRTIKKELGQTGFQSTTIYIGWVAVVLCNISAPSEPETEEIACILNVTMCMWLAKEHSRWRDVHSISEGNFRLIPISLLQSEGKKKEIWLPAFPSLAENFKEAKWMFLTWSSLLNRSVFLNNCIPVLKSRRYVPYWIFTGFFV